MRRDARVDSNQAEIVAALRAVGCTVEHLHMVGKGCPDLAVGRSGVTYLLEVKAPGGRLNSRERRWHDEWRGHVAVVWSVDDALQVVEVE